MIVATWIIRQQSGHGCACVSEQYSLRTTTSSDNDILLTVEMLTPSAIWCVRSEWCSKNNGINSVSGLPKSCWGGPTENADCCPFVLYHQENFHPESCSQEDYAIGTGGHHLIRLQK